MIIDTIYTICYKIRPIRILKIALKIFSAIRMILNDEITYYPKKVQRLEEYFAKLTSKGCALSFSSGTSALEAALYSIKPRISSRNTILVPAMNFHSDLDAILNLGFKIKFIDVDEHGILPSIANIVRAVDEQVGCVLICHLFGYHINTDYLSVFLKERDILLIEDCSHAHCEIKEGINIVKNSDISFFSLQGAKGVAAGEGGIAVTDDRELFIRMSAYSHFGRHDHEFSQYGLIDLIGTGVGHKHRMHPIGAALALEDLRFLSVSNNIIEKNAQRIMKICNKHNMTYSFYGSTSSSRFGGFPLLMQHPEAADRLEMILIGNGIRFKRYPYVQHNKITRYKCYVDLPNTKYVLDRMILLDRRYLEYLPKFKLNIIEACLKEYNQLPI